MDNREIHVAGRDLTLTATPPITTEVMSGVVSFS